MLACFRKVYLTIILIIVNLASSKIMVPLLCIYIGWLYVESFSKPSHTRLPLKVMENMLIDICIASHITVLYSYMHVMYLLWSHTIFVWVNATASLVAALD